MISQKKISVTIRLLLYKVIHISYKEIQYPSVCSCIWLPLTYDFNTLVKIYMYLDLKKFGFMYLLFILSIKLNEKKNR